MRKAILVVVGVGIAALTLTGCAPASSGAGGSSAGGSSASSGSSSAPAGASASGPTGKVAVCSVFTPAALSAASGKSFGETLETDTGDGVYGCAYNSSDGSWDWIIAVEEPTDGALTNDGLDLGGPSVVKPVNGTGYPTVASKAGVSLLFGKDLVEVYTPASDSAAQATTAQFVAVAKAVIVAVGK
jgi:hypothetical protein